jgi:hypothetical protein
VETANVWHVSSFSLDVHLPPLSLIKKTQVTGTDPRETRYVSNKAQVKSGSIVRRNSTGKVYYGKALALRPRRTSLSLSIVA